MTDTASEDNDTDFFDIAVAHGLLDRDRVSDISDHASQAGMHPSDAALSLSAMKPWEVDATRLLMNAKELAPGFELTGLIGCGAAGMVFRAHQSALNRDVALKTINILVLGAVAFAFSTAGGLWFAKALNLILPAGKKINPCIGAAGVSAVPMSARVVQQFVSDTVQFPGFLCDSKESVGISPGGFNTHRR